MAPPVNRSIVRGISLAWREWGAGPVTVVLVHGITSSSLSWQRVAPTLADRYRVIAVDQKGHGDSDKPAAGYRVSDQADELGALIQQLGLNRPHVVGHSWGGAVALQLAASGPDLASVILEDPALYIAPNKLIEVGERFRAETRLTEAELRAQSADLRGWHTVDLEARISSKRQADPAAVFAVFGEAADWNFQPLFAKVACPALLFQADLARGAIVTDRTADLARREFKHGVVTTIPDSDHTIHASQFDRFMAELTEFLARSA